MIIETQVKGNNGTYISKAYKFNCQWCQQTLILEVGTFSFISALFCPYCSGRIETRDTLIDRGLDRQTEGLMDGLTDCTIPKVP